MLDSLKPMTRRYVLSDDGTDITCLSRSHQSLMQLLSYTDRVHFFMPGLRGTEIPAAYLAVQADIWDYYEARHLAGRYSEARQDECEADLRLHLNQLGYQHQRTVLFGYHLASDATAEPRHESSASPPGALVAVFAAAHITQCVLRANIP